MRLHGDEVVDLDRTRFLLGVPNIAERGRDGAAASQCNMDWAMLSDGEQLAPLIGGEITVEGENAFKALMIGAIFPEVRNGHTDPRKWPGPLISEKPHRH
jgi:hypothetical protein